MSVKNMRLLSYLIDAQLIFWQKLPTSHYSRIDQLLLLFPDALQKLNQKLGSVSRKESTCLLLKETGKVSEILQNFG